MRVFGITIARERPYIVRLFVFDLIILKGKAKDLVISYSVYIVNPQLFILKV